MTTTRLVLSTLSASLLSLVAAHAASADNCITQQEANIQMQVLAAQAPNPGTPEESEPAPFNGGWVMNFTNGDFWLDGCHTNETTLPAFQAGHGFQVGGFVVGAIRQKYEGMNGSSSVLVWPVSNEEETPSNDGRVSYFEGQWTDGSPDGAIYWSAASGALSMHGIIFQQYYFEYGETKSALGYPLSDERACTLAGCAAGGRENLMQHGFLEFAPTSGFPSETDAAWAVLNVPSESPHLAVYNTTFGQDIAQLQIAGSGFGAGQHVQVSLNLPSGRTVLENLVANSAGGFLISTYGVGTNDGIGGEAPYQNHVIGTVEAIGGAVDALASVELR